MQRALLGVVDGTIEPMTELVDCPGLPEPGVALTVYSGVDHDSWTRTDDLTAGHDHLRAVSGN